MKLSIFRLLKDTRLASRKLTGPLLMLGLGLTLAAISSGPWPAPAFGQSPTIRFVVPFAAGGGADGVARVVASGLSTQLGRTVIVENRPGANTLIAAEFVANSEPDGNTLLFTFDETFTVNPHLQQARAFDPNKELIPVNLLGRYLLAILVNASLPIHSLNDLIEQARARPKAFSYSSAGPSSLTHLSMEMLKSLAKIDMLHVPYRGVAPALTAVAAGDVQLSTSGYGTARGLIEGNRLRPIAVAGPARIAQLPDLPTTKELGYGKVDATSWLGTAVPAKTPRETINQVNAALSRVLEDETIRKQLIEARYFDILNIGPEEFSEQIRQKFQLMKEAVEIANAAENK